MTAHTRRRVTLSVPVSEADWERDALDVLAEPLLALRPGWHSDALHRGKIKVVYSGSATDQPPERRRGTGPRQRRGDQPQG